MIKACLFDMDGVIVDTAKFHFMAWRRLADTLSIPFTAEQNEQLKGVSRVDSLERILAWGHLVLDNDKKLALMELKNKWYLEYVETVAPADMLPGVPELLADLHANDIAIGLGSSSKNSVLILEKLGILHYFATIIDGTKITFSKPHPEVFEKGARELGLAPSEIVVFEDAISGVGAAKAGGFHCIGIGDSDVLKEADVVLKDVNGLTYSHINKLLNLA